MSKPLVFISYSHKDEIWKDLFKPQLDALEMADQIVVWDDRDIDGGDKWYPKLEEAMSKAVVAVCLISENFLASKFCVKEEVPFLLKRTEENNMLLIPVLLSPCTWKAHRWIKETQMLPRDGKSIIKDYKDDWAVAFSEVSDLIFKRVDNPDYSTPEPTIKWSLPEKIDIDRLPVAGAELFGRDKELKQLDEAWESAETNIISFIAWGGVGKSTLINKWLGYMGADNYKDAETIFAWSFYSQGTNEQVSSADSFISEALIWFGDSNSTKGSAWDKGQRLAVLIRQRKTLLILDGMEPLQSSHEFERGKIKDQGLAALIRSLAMNNNGLCIITSRENVADISKYERKIEQINLEKLSVDAGRALLRVGGVKGTDKELEEAVEKFGYYALAVKLLPVYLRSIKDHHISEALQIPDLNIPEEKGRHPRRVIEALFQRFVDKPEGDLLKILGLFNRPADIEAIKKIIEQSVIKDLTENICNKGATALLQSINTLRKENLLAEESKHRPDSLDCHPLIREHFGEKLERGNSVAWKEAHTRLYGYYKNLPEKLYGKELPDTLEEMEPLFAAVMHGCLAGRHQETEIDIYWKRIKRNNEQYIYNKLGAFGADLSCLSNFFESLWDKPVSGLNDNIKAVVLSWAGFALRAVGRLSDAVQPMKTCLKLFENNNAKDDVAISASNLSELYLTLGDVAFAQKYGAQSVAFADRSGNGFQMVVNRCTHADAYHQAGNNKAAEKLLSEAENMQKKREPENPWLYSLSGFRFCDLLLSMGKYQEVLDRAQATIKYENERWYTLLSVALDKLTIGKAYMFQIVTSSTDPHQMGNNRWCSSKAENYLNQAVDGLRKAGTQHNLPWGLFARATFFRHQKKFQKSWIDLDEAREIAEYGQMRLHLTDYHLEACRNIKDQLAIDTPLGKQGLASKQPAKKTKSGKLANKDYQIIEDGETLSLSKEEMQVKFQEHFKEAERLVKETGYHRRDGEVEKLRIINDEL